MWNLDGNPKFHPKFKISTNSKIFAEILFDFGLGRELAWAGWIWLGDLPVYGLDLAESGWIWSDLLKFGWIWLNLAGSV